MICYANIKKLSRVKELLSAVFLRALSPSLVHLNLGIACLFGFSHLPYQENEKSQGNVIAYQISGENKHIPLILETVIEILEFFCLYSLKKSIPSCCKINQKTVYVISRYYKMLFFFFHGEIRVRLFKPIGYCFLNRLAYDKRCAIFFILF